MHNDPIETIKYKGYSIKVYPDTTDYINPIKDWDGGAHFACWHRRYDLGNVDTRHMEPNKFLEVLKRNNAVFMPLYLYDHSGITISCDPFSCHWDSGRVGYVYMNKDEILERWMWKKLTPKRIKKVKEAFKAEVECYDDYLTGNVFGYVIENLDGEEEDSCWGFFGDEEKKGMIKECESQIRYYIERELKKHGEQLKLKLEMV